MKNIQNKENENIASIIETGYRSGKDRRIVRSEAEKRKKRNRRRNKQAKLSRRKNRK